MPDINIYNNHTPSKRSEPPTVRKLVLQILGGTIALILAALAAIASQLFKK